MIKYCFNFLGVPVVYKWVKMVWKMFVDFNSFFIFSFSSYTSQLRLRFGCKKTFVTFWSIRQNTPTTNKLNNRSLYLGTLISVFFLLFRVRHQENFVRNNNWFCVFLSRYGKCALGHIFEWSLIICQLFLVRPLSDPPPILIFHEICCQSINSWQRQVISHGDTHNWRKRWRKERERRYKSKIHLPNVPSLCHWV